MELAGTRRALEAAARQQQDALAAAEQGVRASAVTPSPNSNPEPGPNPNVTLILTQVLQTLERLLGRVQAQLQSFMRQG